MDTITNDENNNSEKGRNTDTKIQPKSGRKVVGE